MVLEFLNCLQTGLSKSLKISISILLYLYQNYLNSEFNFGRELNCQF